MKDGKALAPHDTSNVFCFGKKVFFFANKKYTCYNFPAAELRFEGCRSLEALIDEGLTVGSATMFFVPRSPPWSNFSFSQAVQVFGCFDDG